MKEGVGKYWKYLVPWSDGTDETRALKSETSGGDTPESKLKDILPMTRSWILKGPMVCIQKNYESLSGVPGSGSHAPSRLFKNEV